MSAKTLAEAKANAKSLRKALAADGTAVSHAQALELIARQNGARDWNTLSASLAKEVPSPLQLHERVLGRYLGQPFEGIITGISSRGTLYAITLRFDEPVDVVTFAGFSNMRRVVRGVVDRHGVSVSKTSNGTPHLVLLNIKSPAQAGD